MKNYSFTDEQIELIGGALGQLPFAQVAALITEIQTQFNEQLPDIEDKA